jgi:hypothetical protein
MKDVAAQKKTSNDNDEPRRSPDVYQVKNKNEIRSGSIFLDRSISKERRI